jgi:NADH-quinone oxidoreductase subunit C
MSELHGMFGASGSGDTSGFGGLVKSTISIGSSQRPYGSYFDEVTDELERAYPEFSDAIEKVVVDRGELTLHIKREKLFETAMKLRDTQSLRFEMCLGVSGVHYPEDKDRELHAVYPLLSMTHNRRIRLEVSTPDSDPHIPSLVEVWAGNNWHERETWDMFGIIFDGHPGLTRILMPDDWPGHPQRKDYPLGGIPIEYKGATVPAPSERRSYQ